MMQTSQLFFVYNILLLFNFYFKNSNYISPVYSLSSLYGKTTRNIATQTLQGTGPPIVDLNQYNLPLDSIEEGWTANFVQKPTENKGRVRLGTKGIENYVDTVIVSFPRNDGGGIGIELSELAGGRSDGLGITIVSGLVEGGSAEQAELFPGDSLASVTLIRRQRQITVENKKPIYEKEEEWKVLTECLAYDDTVNAIGTLPTIKQGFEDVFVLKIKRLRRRPKVSVKLQYPPNQKEDDETIEMYAGENLRQGMLIRGVKLNDPLAQRFDTKQSGNCGAGGLCRTCSVVVSSGADVLNPQRVAEKQMMQDNPRWRLACKAVVGYGMKEGEMIIRVNPNQW
jgi:ferredoxin